MKLLSEEAELEEMVKLVGMDALSSGDRLKMEAARSIREDFLHQLAFHEVDTYTSAKKQHLMMKLVCEFYDKSLDALDNGADIENIVKIPVRENIGRFKYLPEDDIEERYNSLISQLTEQLDNALKGEDN